MANADMAKQMMKQQFGISDEDFQIHMSYPQNRKLAQRIPELMKYKIVAEVTEAKYCGAGLKVGQKFVFNTFPAMLIPGESDCPLCVRALGPIANLIVGFWDRMIEGADPNEGLWSVAECLDPGIKRGGLGHVVFKVSAKKI